MLTEEHSKHPDSPLMFWCPRINGYWSPDSLRHLHKQMLAAAGVDKSVRFHDLRHTFSTLAIQSGIDAKTVAGMLGHYQREKKRWEALIDTEIWELNTLG